MNVREAQKVLILIGAYFPHQQFDQFSPPAWAIELDWARVEDALAAVRDLAGEQEYIGIDDLARRIRKMRSQRVTDHPPVEPPYEIGADPARYVEWLRGINARIADGETISQQSITGPGRPVKALGRAVE